jgi:predicted ArsR family transcriptional regulator
MIDLASDIDLETVHDVLTRFLLSQATSGHRTGKQWTVSEIAAHLGTEHGAIRRSLHSLDREGVIRLERGRLVISDCTVASGQLLGLESIESCSSPLDRRE